MTIMQSVTEWVRQLTCFYILSNLFISILPNSGYKKYIKTFIGVLLIMLVINPVTAFLKKGINFDSMLNMEMSALEHTDNIMWMKINGAGSNSTIIETYKKEIQKNIDKKAWEYALYVNNCNIEIETDSKSENFGKITGISISLSECKKEDIRVDIGKIDTINTKSSANPGENEELTPECAKIKEYIAAQYQVEPDNVVITLMN